MFLRLQFKIVGTVVKRNYRAVTHQIAIEKIHTPKMLKCPFYQATCKAPFYVQVFKLQVKLVTLKKIHSSITN